MAMAAADDKDRHIAKRLHFVCEDWLENGQPSGCFDRVIAMESTEHMRDKARAFAEMSRVLRPGGRAVVVAWLAANHRAHWQDAHLIEPICRAYVSASPDVRQWAARARITQARAAVLASGDVSVVLADLFGETVERLGTVARDDLRAHELLRFVLSRPYFDLRRSLGLEGQA